MLSKFEVMGIGMSVAVMALALYLVRVETSVMSSVAPDSQSASVAGTVVIEDESGRAGALLEAADERGNLEKLVIEDIVIGTGAEVKEGDTVEVHYIGRLQSGEEFDNSQKRGTPFQFTVGDGRVIAGWEQGLVGMKVGGQRILVIPPDLAYGNRQVGPIPANSTLVFAIELISIKE